MKDEASKGGASINLRIARQVRERRRAQGLSLAALAARCEVSRSMLSLIERGESSATAVVLEKIATGLGVPLAWLFDDAAAAGPPVSRAADREWWRDPDSQYVRCNVSPAHFPSPLRIVEVVLPGGARVAYETGSRTPVVHQQVWVLEGRIEVTVGATRHGLARGDCLAMQLDAPTAFKNPARSPARYAVVIATGGPLREAGR